MELIGIDFNNTFVGNGLSDASGHPAHVNEGNVLLKINSEFLSLMKRTTLNGLVIITNQDGTVYHRKQGSRHVARMFEKVMKHEPFVKGILWSEPLVEWGQKCSYIVRQGDGGYHFGTQVTGEGMPRNYRKPNTGMGQLALDLGFDINLYIGDQSGLDVNWIHGSNSDAMFAQNMEWDYLDVNYLVRNFKESSGAQGKSIKQFLSS